METIRIRFAFTIAVALFSSSIACHAQSQQEVVPVVPQHGVFHELPLSSVKAKGWIRQWLLTQRDGLTGHAENGGYPYNTFGWAGKCIKENPDKNTWSAYEQYGYWIDAMVRAGHLLDDQFLLDKSRRQIDYVLDHPSPSGIIGPDVWYIEWPHVVLFRALMAEYSATGDRQITDAMHKHYLAEIEQKKLFAKEDRNNCNAEILCWLYGLTGDRRMLDAAVKIYTESGHMKSLQSDKPAEGHCVTFNEKGKLPAILYMYTGDKTYLDASIKGFRKLDAQHMLIDGCPSAAEGLLGRGSRAPHETCNIADYSWAVGYLLMATGDAEWADKIERAVFNAGPGSVTKDFKAHQYYSSPNQVLCTHGSGHAMFDRNRFAYRPGHDVECCTGGVNRFMPNYLSRMWMSNGSDGLVAAFYGPSQISYKVGDQNLTIVEKTDYPFSEQIEFQVQTDKPVKFPLDLRIPSWCESPSLTINEKPADVLLKAGTYARLEQTFSNGDKIVLTLPMKVKVTRWPDNGLGVERGPLAYSLAIKENRTIDKTDKRSTAEFPAYDMVPDSPWNYALDVDPAQAEKVVKVIQGAPNDKPYSEPFVQLQLPARRVKNWVLTRSFDIKTGEDYYSTPALPLTGELTDQVETITLVPLGATTLRLTIFPNARELKTDPQH